MTRVAIEFDTEDQAGYLPQVESLMAELGIETQRLNCYEIIAGALHGFDALTFPGGVGACEGLRIYGDNFAKAVQFFVASGGGYLGMCGGAYVAGRGIPYVFALYTRNSLNLIDMRTKAPPMVQFIQGYRQLQEERLAASCDISQIGHPITEWHEGERVDLVYSGGPLLEECGPSVTPLAWYYDDVLSEAAGKVALACSQFGKGRVVVSGPHPEAPWGAGINIGEPCCKWLYQAMVRYVIEPEPEAVFPIIPWSQVKPLVSPIVPLSLGGGMMLGIFGMAIGGVITRARKEEY